MTDLELKKNHEYMWDYIISEIEASKINFFGIPEIFTLKKSYCLENNIRKIYNNCFACHYTLSIVEREHISDDCNYCKFCPLDILECTEKDSPYEKLLRLEDTNMYDEAISLAEEIRNSWTEK